MIFVENMKQERLKYLKFNSPQAYFLVAVTSWEYITWHFRLNLIP